MNSGRHAFADNASFRPRRAAADFGETQSSRSRFSAFLAGSVRRMAGGGEGSQGLAQTVLADGEDEHMRFIGRNEPRIKTLNHEGAKTGSFYYHCDWHASRYNTPMLNVFFGWVL